MSRRLVRGTAARLSGAGWSDTGTGTGGMRDAGTDGGVWCGSGVLQGVEQEREKDVWAGPGSALVGGTRRYVQGVDGRLQ